MRFADVVVAADTRVEPDPEQSGRPGYHPGRDALVRALGPSVNPLSPRPDAGQQPRERTGAGSGNVCDR